jgi:tetratricopeptide (TPR) repeat protein
VDVAALLAEARGLDATDPARALELRERVIGNPMSHVWSEAHIELGALAYGRGEFDRSEEHARTVLAAPEQLVKPNARAIAGVLLCLASDGASPDDDELRASIEACIALGESYYAACGLTMLGKRRPEVAMSALEEAVVQFNKAGSTFGGPGALRRLALIAFAQERYTDAHSYLAQASAQLAKQATPATRDAVQRLATLGATCEAFRIPDPEWRTRIEGVLGRPISLDELALRGSGLGEVQLAVARKLDGADPAACVLYLRLVIPRLDPEHAEELVTHQIRAAP